MGIEKKPVTFRLDAQHEEVIAAAGRCLEPVSTNASFNLRVLLNGVVAYLTTGKMPRWMAEWQGVLRMSACTDSLPSPQSVGRIAARPVTSCKRPPHKLTANPKDRAGLAASETVAGGAWLVPFCEQKLFAFSSLRGV